MYVAQQKKQACFPCTDSWKQVTKSHIKQELVKFLFTMLLCNIVSIMMIIGTQELFFFAVLVSVQTSTVPFSSAHSLLLARGE